MELTIEQMKDELIKDNGSSPEHSYYNYEHSTKWNEVNLGVNATVSGYVEACKEHNVALEDAYITTKVEDDWDGSPDTFYYLEWESIKTKEEWEEWIKDEYKKLQRKKQTQHERDLMQYNILKEKLGL